MSHKRLVTSQSRQRKPMHTNGGEHAPFSASTSVRCTHGWIGVHQGEGHASTNARCTVLRRGRGWPKPMHTTTMMTGNTGAPRRGFTCSSCKCPVYRRNGAHRGDRHASTSVRCTHGWIGGASRGGACLNKRPVYGLKEGERMAQAHAHHHNDDGGGAHAF